MRVLRNFFPIAVALVLTAGWMSGCSKEEPPAPIRAVEVAPEEPPAPADEVEPEEPAPPKPRTPGTYKRVPGTLGYLPTVMGAYQSSKVKLAVAELMHDIRQFYGLKSRYPESLKELEEWRTRPLPPLLRRLAYDYDPETGELQVVDAPPQE